MAGNTEPGPTPAFPLRIPSVGGSEWDARLRETMLAQRVVSLSGELDAQQAGQVALELMSLDASGDEHVTLYVDSGTGTLDGAFTVIDVIDLLGVPVHATCIGRAEGPAAAVIAVSDHRLASPHARFRLCEPVSEAFGRAQDMERYAAQQRSQLHRFASRLAEAAERPPEHVEADLQAGRYLDAAEALEYGLIDEIWKPTRNVVDKARGPLGFQGRKRPQLTAYEEPPPGV